MTTPLTSRYHSSNTASNMLPCFATVLATVVAPTIATAIFNTTLYTTAHSMLYSAKCVKSAGSIASINLDALMRLIPIHFLFTVFLMVVALVTTIKILEKLSSTNLYIKLSILVLWILILLSQALCMTGLVYILLKNTYCFISGLTSGLFLATALLTLAYAISFRKKPLEIITLTTNEYNIYTHTDYIAGNFSIP